MLIAVVSLGIHCFAPCLLVVIVASALVLAFVSSIMIVVLVSVVCLGGFHCWSLLAAVVSFLA